MHTSAGPQRDQAYGIIAVKCEAVPGASIVRSFYITQEKFV